jgi:hypothetical protein
LPVHSPCRRRCRRPRSRRSGSANSTATRPKLDGPFGPFEFRASDHQATLGAFVGKIALKDGRGTMADFKYVDGASVLPSDAEVKKLRPAAD